MCRATAGPLIAVLGVAGTSVGIALTVVRERIDRRADTRAMKKAAEEQEATESDSDDPAGGNA
jgi:xanthosine utilization system XapX-like protein